MEGEILPDLTGISETMGQLDRAAFRKQAVTLVGGAPFGTDVLKAALRFADRIVAADRGADMCLAHDLVPERVIGDMDSLSATARNVFADRLEVIAEQESTDFEKALRGLDSSFVLGVGFLGARIDHALAALSHLATRNGPPVVLLSESDCVLLCPPRIRLDLIRGERVSLWPLAEARLTSTGLHWPLDGLVLSPLGRVGTSNQAEGPILLTCDGPCLLILDAERLDEVLRGLGFGV